MSKKTYKPGPKYYAYVKTVIKRLNDGFFSSGMNQQQIATALGWNKTAVSRVFNYTGDTFVLERVIDVACQLNMDISELMADVDATEPAIPSFSSTTKNGLTSLPDSFDDGLITNPSDRAFHGIINSGSPDDYYYFFTKSTLPEETDVFLKGQLFLTAEKTGNTANLPYCKAKLILQTGKNNPQTEEPETKIYQGEMVISKNMQSCYILLYGKYTAEINLISFDHRYFNTQNLDCKLAGCLTISAGEHHRTTHSKMIISRKEFSDQQLSELEGILHITEPFLMIPEDAIKLADDYDTVMSLLDKFDAKKEVYYKISDKQILYSGNDHGKDLEQLVLRLRNISPSPSCVKVSDTENTLLYHYYKKNFKI